LKIEPIILVQSYSAVCAQKK